MFNKLQSMIGGSSFRLNWKFFIIMIAVSLLIAAIIYVYKTYVAPKLNPQYVANKEFANSTGLFKKASKSSYLPFFSKPKFLVP